MTPGAPPTATGVRVMVCPTNEPLFLMLPLVGSTKKPTPTAVMVGPGLAGSGSQSGISQGLTFCTWIGVVEPEGLYASAVAVALTLWLRLPKLVRRNWVRRFVAP